MEAKELIKNSILKAEKKYLPHFYTDFKEAHEIYALFKSSISSYYSKLLEDSSINKIMHSENTNGDEFFSLDEFFLATNTRKYSAINAVLDIGNIFYKNRSARNKEFDIIINILVSYGVDFIKEISKTIQSNNKKETQNINENLLIKQESDFSFETPILPLFKINNIKKFQEITGQNTLFSLGQGSSLNINLWVDKFCEHAPNAMNCIGLNEKSISISRNIDFFYNNNNTLIKENAFIHYDLKESISDNRLYITFNHTHDDNKIPILILHEWTHGADILIARTYKKDNNFISSSLMGVDNIINKKHPLKKIFDLGESLFSSILNDTDTKSYIAQKKEAISKYKDFSKELIIQIISPTPEDWSNLTNEQKEQIQNLPSFKKLTITPLETIRKKDENAIKSIGRTLHNLISTETYKSIFPNTQHFNITNKSKIILLKTRDYSLKNNISWFHTRDKKGYHENFALTNTDFAQFSCAKGMINKKEYLFYPHEMLARTIQMFAVEAKSYTQTASNNVLTERDNFLKICTQPELPYHTRNVALELIQEMSKKLGIKPEKDFKTLIEDRELEYIEADIENQKRGKLSENNVIIKKIYKINHLEIETCENNLNQRQLKIK